MSMAQARSAPLRLLVIGNSHAAAPRMAYTVEPDRWPDCQIDFLAVRGGNIIKFELRGTVLHPTDARTTEEMQKFNRVKQLDLAPYDRIALVGGFGWPNMAGMFDSHRCVDFPSVIAGDQDGQLIGRQLLDLALQVRVRRGFSVRLMRVLQPLGKPMLLMPEPLPSGECNLDPDGYGDYLMMAARGDAGHCRRLLMRAAHAVLGDQAALPFWPEAAVQDDAFTAPHLMRGSARLSADGIAVHPASDFAHGNVEYGGLLLDRIVAGFDPQPATL
ncbi:hypothetical protein FNJ84_01890 [Paracoccus sp. M683]|uniref:hypothetical protein n=1 Tax=Paracoccus sp. M683 TaxID=2594268 RepID=UPI0011808464|nr:hypothetical protein [Paracoccus sp. M683]TRW99447.1 hypothetical protein FNJ84_01890 [Paracoccus sp. M683]